ncbi:MAG TPA: DNA repair protein RadA [Trueperaceae bacterium]|nr:DNA repair protein RadA [Trueperaceae bacterium]
MARSPGYVCRECGAKSPLQTGRCTTCGTWGSMVAEEAPQAAPRAAGRARGQARRLEAVRLDEVSDASLVRYSSGDAEVDRVLGGGWVVGSAALLAGEPGIGKSTLLLQLAQHAVAAGRRVLYVAGEESPAQVRLRADRLGLGAGLELTRENDAHVIADHLRAAAPDLVIVDSIQTLVVEAGGVPGTLTSLRDSTAILVDAAKAAGTTLVLIGHVTKQGSIAGPKVIEHVVDATFALESAAGLRVVRAMKNRFGPAGEVGVFEMTGSGMRAVANPSEAFLAERPIGAPGSVVVAALEGQRPLLLEVQALASKSPYSAPRRVVQGLDARRVDVVLAVLERRLDLPLEALDVFVNVAGGLRVTDPGADLAVAMAVYSAVTNKPAPDRTAFVGEVGLAGELRSVSQLGRRLDEAKRAGHPRLVGPRSRELPDGVGTLRDALLLLWGSP